MTPLLLLTALLVTPSDIVIDKPAPVAESELDKLEELRGAALELHDTASSSKKRAAIDKALKAYGAYLKAAGENARDPGEVRYYMAELLFDAKRFAEASDAFAACAKEAPEHERAIRSAWSAFVSAEEVLKKRRARVHQQRVINTASAYVALVELWLKKGLSPDEDDRPAALWAEAEAQKKLGNTKARRVLLEKLAAEFPDDVFGNNAIQLLNPPK